MADTLNLPDPNPVVNVWNSTDDENGDIQVTLRQPWYMNEVAKRSQRRSKGMENGQNVKTKSCDEFNNSPDLNSLGISNGNENNSHLRQRYSSDPYFNNKKTSLLSPTDTQRINVNKELAMSVIHIEHLQQVLADQSANQIELQATTANLQGVNDELTQRCRAQMNRIEYLQHHIFAHNASQSELKQEVDNLRKQLESQQFELDDKTREFVEILQHLKLKSQELEECKEELAILKQGQSKGKEDQQISENQPQDFNETMRELAQKNKELEEKTLQLEEANRELEQFKLHGAELLGINMKWKEKNKEQAEKLTAQAREIHVLRHLQASSTHASKDGVNSIQTTAEVTHVFNMADDQGASEDLEVRIPSQQEREKLEQQALQLSKQTRDIKQLKEALETVAEKRGATGNEGGKSPRTLTVGEDYKHLTTKTWRDAFANLDKSMPSADARMKLLCDILIICQEQSRVVYNSALFSLKECLVQPPAQRQHSLAASSKSTSGPKRLSEHGATMVKDVHRQYSMTIDLSVVIQAIDGAIKMKYPKLNRSLLRAYIEAGARLTWKMITKKPAMSFDAFCTGDQWENVDSKTTVPYEGSEPDAKGARIQYYVFPVVKQGNKSIIAKGKAMVRPPKPSVKK